MAYGTQRINTTLTSVLQKRNRCQYEELGWVGYPDSSSPSDEGHGAGWKLRYLFYFHRDLSTLAMCRSHSFLLKYFLSFYLSRFSFYIIIIPWIIDVSYRKLIFFSFFFSFFSFLLEGDLCTIDVIIFFRGFYL